MQIVEAILLVLAFFFILGIFIAIHAWMKNEFKVEASWVGVAVIPLIIWLVTAGQLSEFGGFGLNLKLRDATTVPLSRLASEGTFETEPVLADEKASPDKIGEYIEKKLEALSFELGREGYYDPGVVRDYLTRLGKNDFFRYVIFLREDDSFAGLIPVKMLFEELDNKERRGLIEDRWQYFVRLIEVKALDELRGVVTVSVEKDSSKGEALHAMAKHDLPQLPVVDRDGRFVGVVDQAKLANSVLIEFLSQL